VYGFYRRVQAYIFFNNVKKKVSIKIHIWRNFLTKCFIVFYYLYLYNAITPNINIYLGFVGDFTTIKGCLLTLLILFNLDNWVLYLYTYYITGGFFSYFIANNNKLLLYFSFLDLYNTYKNNQLFLFFIIKEFIFTTITTIKSTQLFSVIFFFNYDNTISSPALLFFSFLFFVSVLSSWLFFPFLGLYGIFYLNLFTLFFFWVSLSFLAQTVLINHNIIIIKLCSWVFLNSNTKIDYYFLLDSISFSFA
jgi:hypothetical protein